MADAKRRWQRQRRVFRPWIPVPGRHVSSPGAPRGAGRSSAPWHIKVESPSCGTVPLDVARVIGHPAVEGHLERSGPPVRRWDRTKAPVVLVRAFRMIHRLASVFLPLVPIHEPSSPVRKGARCCGHVQQLASRALPHHRDRTPGMPCSWSKKIPFDPCGSKTASLASAPFAQMRCSTPRGVTGPTAPSSLNAAQRTL